MRLFVYEHLTAFGGSDLPGAGNPSLLREGLAMLQAVVEDLSQVENLQVVVPLSSRIDWSPPSAVRIISTDSVIPGSAISRGESFQAWLSGVDAALIVAPELGGILEFLTRQIEAAKILNLGSSAEAVRIAGDKLLTGEKLTEHSVPTISTWKLFEGGRIATEVWDAWQTELANWPVLIKPRFGAGSQEMSVHSAPPSLEEIQRLLDGASWLGDSVVQPYVAGSACSVAVWCAGNDRDYAPLPVGDQLLADARRFEYQGGIIPSQKNPPGSFRYREVSELAVRACRAVSGLKGYVGVDVIVPDDERQSPLVCEINPRLTTSYLGYRSLCRSNLAAQWLRYEPGALEFRDQRVRFFCDGLVEVC